MRIVPYIQNKESRLWDTASDDEVVYVGYMGRGNDRVYAHARCAEKKVGEVDAADIRVMDTETDRYRFCAYCGAGFTFCIRGIESESTEANHFI